MNFYKNAALALDHLDKHQGSVKGCLRAAGLDVSPGEAGRLLALLIETLKYRPVLTSILTTVPLLQLEKLTFPKKTAFRQPSSNSLLQVMLHDLLFSPKKKIEASDKWPPKEAVMRHQTRLRSELVRIQIKEGKSRKEDLGKMAADGDGARYVRYNPNIDAARSDDFSLEALHAHLKTKHGFTKIDKPVFPVPSNQYFMDEHLDEVLVFPASTGWWTGDVWYESGAVILQDKASCMPAKILLEGWEDDKGDCLDATAAPGNKTSYISALMGNKGTLHAYEKSEGRYKTLQQMLDRAGCKNVKPRRADFTQSDPTHNQFTKVTRILLDPSCSGSGIVNRLDYLLEGDNTEQDETDAKAERLEKLASFQLQMILHAFKFKSVKRVVYSTCSIHAEEDEHVIMKALASKEAKARGWTLAPRSEVLPAWERRGRPSEMGDNKELADGVIRCLPEDKTNGFFVACFIRGQPTSATETSKKRAIDDDALMDGMSETSDLEVEDPKQAVGSETKVTTVEKTKTAAQAERLRRKKQLQLQKKKRKVAK